jgi:hypothetical protein
MARRHCVLHWALLCKRVRRTLLFSVGLCYIRVSSNFQFMSVIANLASSLGRRDEVPNQLLADQIVQRNDAKGVKELVANLRNDDKNIQSDCIKVLYEIGYRSPSMIAPYHKEFLALLANKNNRIVWGAMTALDMITPEKPKKIFEMLPRIMEVADSGAVITRDHAVGILTKLAGIKQYADKAFSLLIEQLKKCPTNQLPMYAESALSIVDEKNKTVFVKTLKARLGEVEKESKRRRIEKVMRLV